MRLTPHKTETGEKRQENRKPPDVPFVEGTDGSTDLSAERHPQQREVEPAAAPGGLYRATVDCPSKIDPRGFENPDVSANSGNWASLNSEGSPLAITPLSSTPCSAQVVGALLLTPCSTQIMGSMSSTSSSTLVMSSRGLSARRLFLSLSGGSARESYAEFSLSLSCGTFWPMGTSMRW